MLLCFLYTFLNLNLKNVKRVQTTPKKLSLTGRTRVRSGIPCQKVVIELGGWAKINAQRLGGVRDRLIEIRLIAEPQNMLCDVVVFILV